DAVWCDISEVGLKVSDAWWSKIVQEVTTRDVFIIVLSPDAMKSEWVMRELDMAIIGRKRIVPLLYQDCTVRLDLRSIQTISFLSPDTYNYDFDQLLKALIMPI